MITAPYNFVPLNKKVFYPPWAEDISHDIPFSDGESGEIEITIEAKSPIFIRDGKNDEEFCNFINKDGAKEFYIPGSSLKGAVRSVMEIMGFAKLNFFDDKRFSVRDMTDRKNLVGQSNGCGFLIKRENGYVIEDCGNPVTISFSEVKKATDVYTKHFKSASEKYNATNGCLKQIPIEQQKKMMNIRGRQIPKQIAIYNPFSNEKATLVFTGDINNKKNEFVFISKNNFIQVSQSVVEDFKSVYFNENSIDGTYWQKKFKETKKIPVFYKKNGNEIVAIGLTQLFKLAYKKSISDAIVQDKKDTPDLTEAIFGYTKDKKALKGRVQFSHFKATTIRYEASNYKNQRAKEEVLGEPKQTYYPNYIEQTDINRNRVNKYKTLMDEDAHISGRKRYPLRQTITTNPVSANDDGVENENVATKFKPLDSGTTFKGKIRFHNLKPQEIGALISALTLHGNSNTHYLNLGMAKPLGYGKVKINIDKIVTHKYSNNTIENRQIEPYLKEFEKTMRLFEPNWLQSNPIKELFATTCANTNNDGNLVYQKLKNNQDKNDFVEDKKARKYLKRYSQWQNQGCSHNTHTLVSQDEIEEFKKDIDKRLEEILQKVIQKDLKETKYNPRDLCKYINDEELNEETLFAYDSVLYDLANYSEKIEPLLKKYCNNQLSYIEKEKLINILQKG